MPIYEYEPDDRDCLMCEGRIAVIQGIEEPHLQYCPYCGLDVKRVISRASFKIGKENDYTDAAKKGFTTWRRLEEGKWEKIDGPGEDMIVASEEDIQAVRAEKEQKAKVIDLDTPSS